MTAATGHPTTTEAAVPLSELVALFVGDADSEACPHLNLVVALCERLRPRSAAILIELLYPVTREAPDELVDRIVRWGYELWLQQVYERDPDEWEALPRSAE